VLQGEGVSHNFGGLMAVNDADFYVGEGEIVGLIGPNGAGKTTLFNLISGAITANAGTIRFKGEDITKMKPHQICLKGMARTFQTVKLFPNMTALENIRLALLYGRRGTYYTEKTSEKEINQLMASMGILNDRLRLAGDLPIASQRRLEIARALATKPDLILLDEVMAGLAPSELEQSMQLIARIRDSGTTVFMIEHVMKAIMEVCDRIMVFHNGSKIAEGMPDEVANNSDVVRIYLGE
jgi:branched-chain amino acid transport system ATP-binding protein